MGCRLSFTIMAASLDVVTPRVQTINNDPMATCTGHFTAGGSIKFRDNRWIQVQSALVQYDLVQYSLAYILASLPNPPIYVQPVARSPGRSHICCQVQNTYEICWNAGFVNTLYPYAEECAEKSTRFVSSMPKRLQEALK
ncbi:hypothetical protein TNCV_4461021 [Trichonephila clavipes]|nr:hypothetical protein TNCV_4461021 [Trichonephila clavipes]